MTLYEHEEIARKEGRAEGRAEGRTEGRAEGKLENAHRVVQNLLKKGFSIEEACEVAEITTEQYEESLRS